jgi:hypothetical protein
VEINMKARTETSLWSIIERLQRRLEHRGMSQHEADRAVTLTLRQLAALQAR